MTFALLTRAVFGDDLPPERFAELTDAMMQAYLDGIAAWAWEYEGTKYVGGQPLRDIIAVVLATGQPYMGQPLQEKTNDA